MGKSRSILTMKQLNKSDLYHYQRDSVEHVLAKPYSGLFLDMGLGKTTIMLTAINALIYEELEINTVLVVGPKRVVSSTWPDEVAKWSHLKNLRVSKIIGTVQQRRAAVAQKADVYLVSRDNLVWLIGEFGGSMLPYDMLVADESSSYKNPASVRSKALKAVQPCFKRVVILTGTPAPNGLIDLWFQIWLLDRGERLGKFVTNYKDRFFLRVCPPGSHHGKYVPTEETKERIYKLIGDIVISMKSEDYLDLEPVRFIDVPVELCPKTRKLYEQFERERVMELLESEVTAMTASVMSGKLLQFAGGAVYDDEKNVHEIHDEKLDALEELVEAANGSPVLIAYTFKHELSRILHRLKDYKPVHFQTDKHIKDWNEGKIPVLVMHPASGGHGLNLQHGGHLAIWYSLNWSLELYEQWCKRLPRPGQKKQVIIYRLIATGTEDESVVKSLDSKGRVQDGLMAAVKAKIAKYKNNFKKSVK